MSDTIEKETDRLISEHAEDWQIAGTWQPRSDFDEGHAGTYAEQYRTTAEKSSEALRTHVRQIETVAALALEIIQECRASLQLPKGISLTETVAKLQELRAN